ncbi:hypothetical protein I4U23_030637 [Adineta vaga]|nr:hypothetical protein I4U23_030637 [Adineta vaga]
MPLSIESEIDLLYHLSTMSEHVLPKGIFYLLLWKRLNQSSIPPAFSFKEMVDHLRTLYDESVFDNPELPESNDHDFEWHPIKNNQEEEPQLQYNEKDLSNKSETIATLPTASPVVAKTRKRPSSPTPSTPNSDTGRRSGRQKLNPHPKDEDEQQQSKIEKRKSTKDSSRISTRSIPTNDSIGTRLRGQK